MSSAIPFFPPSASSIAPEMDLLYAFLTATCAFFAVVVVVALGYFMLKYRRQHPDDVGADIHGSLILEIGWTIIPLIVSLVMFGWGASLFFRLAKPPANAMEIVVVGKQWMWKVQHPEGVREINELHVPLGQPVRLTIGSEDVIHDFAIPAFRVRMDAVPGKLTTLWFTATETGEFHIYCDQYCGTRHASMIGVVYVMPPEQYEAWVAGGRSSISPIQEGERLFSEYQCSTCHKADRSGRGPSLAGLYGSSVTLADGRHVVADENYLRESILNSQVSIVQGYPAIMPAYQGLISEENVLQLLTYIKSLTPPAASTEKK